MPSLEHDTLAELFRTNPRLAAEVVTHLGVDLPTWHQARAEPADLPELTPAEHYADVVVTLTGADGQPALAVVVEVQLGRDRDKVYSWPAYLANLRWRLRCPVVLLIVCRSARIAARCARPIQLGPGFTLTPQVLGPEQVPLVTDPVEATRTPELAVLSAMAHGTDPKRGQVFQALLAALDHVHPDHATLYAGIVWRVLPKSARPELEELMSTATTPYRDYLSPFVNRFVNQGRREGEATGEAKGEAKAVLRVLAARGIEVPDDARERIRTCTDLEQLDVWVTRAATARTIDDLFDEATA